MRRVARTLRMENCTRTARFWSASSATPNRSEGTEVVLPFAPMVKNKLFRLAWLALSAACFGSCADSASDGPMSANTSSGSSSTGAMPGDPAAGATGGGPLGVGATNPAAAPGGSVSGSASSSDPGNGDTMSGSSGNSGAAGGAGEERGATGTEGSGGGVDSGAMMSGGRASDAPTSGDGDGDSGGTTSDGNASGDTTSDGNGSSGLMSGDAGSGSADSPAKSVFPDGVSAPRIMIVGDSISAGPGCYKKYLLAQLQEAGIMDFEFVGEYDDDCGGGVRHSAVSCTTSGQYTQQTFAVPNCFASTTFPGMPTLMEAHNPDLVMIQLGVNDVWNGTAPVQPILNNYATLIEQARAHNPDIVVVVAQIHRIITDNCTNDASTAKAEELVMAVPAWAQSVTQDTSPVVVADLWTNSDAREADDCVHPNDAGAQRMASNWFNALEPLLR